MPQKRSFGEVYFGGARDALEVLAKAATLAKQHDVVLTGPVAGCPLCLQAVNGARCLTMQLRQVRTDDGNALVWQAEILLSIGDSAVVLSMPSLSSSMLVRGEPHDAVDKRLFTAMELSAVQGYIARVDHSYAEMVLVHGVFRIFKEGPRPSC